MKTNPRKIRQPGFALIVTLSLMILLTVIAVGLLTLSTISLRSTSQGAAQAVANSNAKLALMLAIGDLQKHLGPDQRISADAASFKDGSPQPNVVGVWDSLGWIPDGSGVAPAPDPSDKAAKFRTWLVSTKSNTVPFGYVDSAPPSDSVWLSDPATAGKIDDNDPTMRAARIPLTVGTTRGGLAWMVSDNSTKAQVNITPKVSNDIASNIANRTTGTAPNALVLNDKLKVDEPSRLISLPTYAMAVGGGDENTMKEVTARASALTTASNGLLTDPVLGGLKTDLTPLMESGTSVSLSNALGELADSSATGDFPYYSNNFGVPKWNLLREHYQKYKKVTGQGTGEPRLFIRNTDLFISSTGITPRPNNLQLMPIIAKLQIMFSLVSHHSHAGGRVNAYNQYGIPQGNNNHAVPHLVYDPVITLYNPYDVELELAQLRVKITNPPVGFQFQKNEASGTNTWFRNEFGSGAYHSMGSFQIANEGNPKAIKEFIFFLRYKNGGGYQGNANIKLLPGETKVFSASVESNWNWGLETAGGGVRAFFDWQAGDNLGKVDKRSNNLKGVETVPGIDFRAGLQTDHLSYSDDRRPAANRYGFEYQNGSNGARRTDMGQGWVSLKLTDSVTVNCKPERMASGSLPDFRVELLAGVNNTATSDILRRYDFTLGDVANEMLVSGSPGGNISRKFSVQSILQTPSDNTPGGKSPFAIFTMTAKTTADQRDDSKSWLFNNPVTEGADHQSGKIGNAAQSYDLRLQEVQDFTSFPGIEVDLGPQNAPRNRGYFGAIANASDGVSIVPMFRLPITPAASLGDWIGANLIFTSQFPRVNYALGNSFAHPLIPASDISATSPMGSGRMLDHSYLMNAVMWDRYYFSTATDYQSAAFSNSRGKDAVLEDFFTGEERLLNSRLIPYISGSGDGKAIADEFDSMSEVDSSKKFARNAMIEGAFNVNSGSVDAWRAVLSSLRETPVLGYKGQSETVNGRTPFARVGLPMAGSSDIANPANTAEVMGQVRWAGYRSLSDAQIEDLAEKIVDEIRARNSEDDAPSLCLGDFINRRPGSASSVHALKGILQTAIDKTSINTAFHNEDSRSISGSSLPGDRTAGLNNINALDGFTGDGAAPMLTQGDLLTGLAPIITARGDTFTIRTYGEARAANGTTVLAKAWCEATVQRIPDYVDPTDPAEFNVVGGRGDITASGLTPANQTFGRRFVVTSFRWLNSTEI